MEKPTNLDPLADRVLNLLAGRAEAAEIVLGGYLALQHYLSYRTTHDVDAWWRARLSERTLDAVRAVMRAVAAERGEELRERRFGETVSFELSRGGKKSFSFQIAVRSVELEPPVPSAWPPIGVETLADNIGAKMNALVDRGAPRDLRDIRMVVEQGLASRDACWELWGRKNPGEDPARAKQKVLLHLAALEKRRPLESISDPAARRDAEATRSWFRQVFLQ